MAEVQRNATILFLYIIFHQEISKYFKEKEGNYIKPFYR